MNKRSKRGYGYHFRVTIPQLRSVSLSKTNGVSGDLSDFPNPIEERSTHYHLFTGYYKPLTPTALNARIRAIVDGRVRSDHCGNNVPISTVFKLQPVSSTAYKLASKALIHYRLKKALHKSLLLPETLHPRAQGTDGTRQEYIYP